MKVFVRLIIAAVLLFSICPPSQADEQVSNPQYTAWARFGVGSSATLAGTFDAGQVQVSLSTTRTLKEKADDHVVLDFSASMTMMGESHTTPAKLQTIDAKVSKQDLKELGSEKVEAAGKTYDCKLYQWKDKTANADSGEVKVWVSEDVPGGAVKMEVKTRRGTIVQVLKSVEIK